MICHHTWGPYKKRWSGELRGVIQERRCLLCGATQPLYIPGRWPTYCIRVDRGRYVDFPREER